jgi:hypothetical protein
MMLWAHLVGIKPADVISLIFSVRFNVLELLARNLLQGGRKRQNKGFSVKELSPSID